MTTTESRLSGWGKESSPWRNIADGDWNNLQWQLKNLVRTPDQLVEYLGVSDSEGELAIITRRFVRHLDKARCLARRAQRADPQQSATGTARRSTTGPDAGVGATGSRLGFCACWTSADYPESSQSPTRVDRSLLLLVAAARRRLLSRSPR